MKGIKSIRRGEKLIITILVIFFIGMAILVLKIATQAASYMTYSSDITFGKVYDRNGDVLFDPEADTETYDYDHFLDVGNLIGDDSGQMTNTLVSENTELLHNYSLVFGSSGSGEASIVTTLDHEANRAVYDAFGSKNGTAIAYDYKTGEILVCLSKPSVNPLDNYENIDSLESGSLICKAFYGTAPGSTQKVATTAAALETFGYDGLLERTYSCSGSYKTIYGQEIICHNSSGHGTQGIVAGFENSCNPFFAQLVQDMPLENIMSTYRNMGITVNDDEPNTIDINGITSFTASVELHDTSDFDTMWNCMGQSECLASPCQMMMWESAIASKTGTVVEPYLIDHTESAMGFTSHQASVTYGDTIFSADVAQELRDIMIQNGEDHYSSIGYRVGVKSGTAQIESSGTENSLLVGFCVDLHVAFCIVIEDRVSGEVSTADIARTMLNALDK